MAAPAAIPWSVIAALFAVWVAGLVLNVFPGWIWISFTIAVVLLFVNLLSERGATV